MAQPYDEDDADQLGLAHALLGQTPRADFRGIGDALLSAAPSSGSVPLEAKVQHGYITVNKYAGEGGNKFGHVGVSINGGPVFGLDPANTPLGILSALVPVPGVVDPVAPGRSITDQVQVPATAEQMEKARQYLLKNAGPTPYDLEGRNCATFAGGLLGSAGLKGPGYPGDVSPDRLLDALHRLYDKTPPFHPPGVRPTLPGY